MTVCEDCYVLMSSRRSSAEWAIAYELHPIRHYLSERLPKVKEENPTVPRRGERSP